MKDRFFHEVKNFRYERKFVIDAVLGPMVEQSVKLHPAVFREIYHERTINNLYLDACDRRYFYHSLYGVSKRLKVRVRWYGHLLGDVKAPILEFKLKHNQHVGKLSYPLIPFVFDQKISVHNMYEIFRRSSLQETVGDHVKGLELSLLNSYQRKYFLSADGKYRITLDRDISVYDIAPFNNTFLRKVVNRGYWIMELKYNQTEDAAADQIANYFPFRINQSSKYVSGIKCLSGQMDALKIS